MGRDAGGLPTNELEFDGERELPWQVALEVSLAGSKGTKLGAELENLNQVIPISGPWGPAERGYQL